MQQVGKFFPLEPFEDDRRELNCQYCQVAHHTKTDLEQHRGVVVVDEHVPDAFWVTEVDQQGDDNHCVTQETCQHGWAHQGLKFL